MSPSLSLPVTAASATVRRTQRSRNASPTTGATLRVSCRSSPQRAPCECLVSWILVNPLREYLLVLTSKLYDSVTAVGGTIHVPETAVFFSGGGFSNVVRLSSCTFHVFRDRR